MVGLTVASITSVTLLSLERQRKGFVEELQQQAELLLNSLEVTAVNSLEDREIQVLTAPILSPANSTFAPSRGTIFTADGQSIGEGEDGAVEVPDSVLDKLRLQYKTQFFWEGDRLLAGRRVAHSGADLDLELVVVELSTAPFKEDIERALMSALEVGLGASAVSTLLALMLSRTIVGPLKKMVSATERIASGELSERLPEQRGGYELSTVSQSFNRMTEQLQLTISRQRALVRYSLDAIVVLDLQGNVVEFNPAAERIFGCTEEVARNRFFPEMAIASPWRDRLQQDLQLVDREAAACLVGRWQEVEALRANGTRFPAEMSITNIELEGNVLFTVTLRDITERQQAALRLQQSEERFRQIVHSAPIGIALMDSDSQLIRQVNPAWCKIVGYDEEDLLGWPIERLGLTLHKTAKVQNPDSELVHAGTLPTVDVRSVKPPPHPSLSSQRPPPRGALPQPTFTPSPIPSISSHLSPRYQSDRCQIEQRYRRKDGQEIWIGLTVTALSGEGIDRTSLAMVEDITERKLIELQLRHEALHDALTGLPNRTLLLKRLSRASDRYHSFDSGNDFAILFLDCDRFKDINDRLGHEVGDKLLIALAHRLESCVREGDTVARLGGDEFTLLVEHIHDPDESTMVANRIVEALKSPFVFGVHQIVATVSIGIVNSHPRYSNPEDILKDADEAMYRAKMGGRAQHVLYVNDADCRD